MIEFRRLEIDRLLFLRFERVLFREICDEGKISSEGSKGGDIELMSEWVEGGGFGVWVGVGLEVVKLWPAPHLMGLMGEIERSSFLQCTYS